MGKSTYVNLIKTSSNSIPIEKINKILVDKELIILKNSLNKLSKKYELSTSQLTNILEDNIEIPSSIYQDKILSTLESTVRYLKENLNLKYSQIGSLLNRDERTIWVTYHNSIKKSKTKQIILEGINIPIKVLSTRKFSILESSIGYLKEIHNLKFSEISKLFSLDQRTIWTCYNRYKKKMEGDNVAK